MSNIESVSADDKSESNPSLLETSLNVSPSIISTLKDSSKQVPFLCLCQASCLALGILSKVWVGKVLHFGCFNIHLRELVASKRLSSV